MGSNPSVRQFKTDMKVLANQVGYSFEEAMLRMADELIENMRNAAPKDSGTLAASIRKKDVSIRSANRLRPSVLVMAGGKATTRRQANGQVYDYALGVEFGTVDEDPQPFFYNTYRLYQHAGITMFGDSLARTIELNNKIRAARADNYRNESFGLSSQQNGAAVFHKGSK